MTTSNRGREFIKSFEGLRLTSYKAVASEKHFTIGYGHYGADVKQGQTITKQQAEELFSKDLQSLEKELNAMNLNINQNKFDALISFSYNIGMWGLKKSTLLRKVKVNPNDITIRNEFMCWVYSGTTKLKGLERRRIAEADMYFSGC